MAMNLKTAERALKALYVKEVQQTPGCITYIQLSDSPAFGRALECVGLPFGIYTFD